MISREGKKAEYAAVGILLFLYTFYIITHRSYYYVPVLDFFLLIREGVQYLAFSLPYVIQDPPFYSMLVVGISRLVPIRYPEIAVGIIVNLILFLTNTLLVWHLTRKYLGNFAILPVLLIITNPLSYYLVLQPLNTMAFTAVVLVSLTARSKGRTTLAYAIAGFGYLVKHEIVGLLGAYVLVDILDRTNKRKRRTFGLFFRALIPAVVWEVLTAVHNPYANQYLNEALRFASELPNTRYLIDTFVRVPFPIVPVGTVTGSVLVTALALYLAKGFLVWFQKNDRFIRSALLFGLLYSLIHVLYPSDALRYAFPILWLTYFLALWPFTMIKTRKASVSRMMTRTLVVAFALLAAAANASAVSPFLASERERGWQYRVVGEWLTDVPLPRKTLVIMRYSHITTYYTRNPNVEFFDFQRHDCPIACGIRRYQEGSGPYDVLFVKDRFIPESLYEYESAKYEIDKMDEFEQSRLVIPMKERVHFDLPWDVTVFTVDMQTLPQLREEDPEKPYM